MNELKRTTIRLTIKYSLIFFLFIWIFSGGIYLWVNNALGEGYVNRINDTLEQNSTQNGHIELSDGAANIAADIALDKLRDILVTVNIFALIGIPLSAYLISRRTLLPLIKSQDLQQRFVANASHELRTPLAIMLADLDWASKKHRSIEEYEATVKNTRNEVQQMTVLIASLLLLTRLNNRDALAKQTLPIKDLAEKSIRYYSAAAAKRHISFKTELKAAKVTGDANLLAIVFNNLVDNAVKYAKKHSTVYIFSESRGKTVCIRVRNTTEHMDPAQLAHIFDRFYQADAHQSNAGFGLGLAIIKQIIQAHKGTVEATQPEDTTLEITINL